MLIGCRIGNKKCSHSIWVLKACSVRGQIFACRPMVRRPEPGVRGLLSVDKSTPTRSVDQVRRPLGTDSSPWTVSVDMHYLQDYIASVDNEVRIRSQEMQGCR